jgi:hypothetical protein
MPAYTDRAVVAILSVAFFGMLSACASLQEREPRSNVVVARYTFSGSIPVSQTRLVDSASGYRSGRSFSGTIDVYQDGRARLSSTHGSCEGGRVVGDQVNISCNGLRVHVGPNGGTAYVPFRERYQVTTNRCAEYASWSALPGSTPACVRYEKEERTRISTGRDLLLCYAPQRGLAGPGSQPDLTFGSGVARNCHGLTRSSHCGVPDAPSPRLFSPKSCQHSSLSHPGRPGMFSSAASSARLSLITRANHPIALLRVNLEDTH